MFLLANSVLQHIILSSQLHILAVLPGLWPPVDAFHICG
jgi:hypothetical protein